MSLAIYTLKQLQDMHAALFVQTIEACDRVIDLQTQMMQTPYPSPAYALLQAQSGPLKAAMYEKDELFRSIGAELDRRYDEALADGKLRPGA